MFDLEPAVLSNLSRVAADVIAGGAVLFMAGLGAATTYILIKKDEIDKQINNNKQKQK